jgi:hypothetical protein
VRRKTRGIFAADPLNFWIAPAFSHPAPSSTPQSLEKQQKMVEPRGLLDTTIDHRHDRHRRSPPHHLPLLRPHPGRTALTIRDFL